jgi:hypothetical protein
LPLWPRKRSLPRRTMSRVISWLTGDSALDMNAFRIRGLGQSGRNGVREFGGYCTQSIHHGFTWPRTQIYRNIPCPVMILGVELFTSSVDTYIDCSAELRSRSLRLFLGSLSTQNPQASLRPSPEFRKQEPDPSACVPGPLGTVGSRWPGSP